MFDNLQETYPDPIDERLFPYYLHLEEAVSLLADASSIAKYAYVEMVEKSFHDLTIAKNVINGSGEKGD